MKRTRVPRWLQAARLRPPGQEAESEGRWLTRALARAGVLPLAEAEAAVRAGRVEVAGSVEREPLRPLAPGAAVRLDGRLLELEAAPAHVLLLHKPAGLVVAGADPEGRGTVFEHLRRVLPPALQGFEWYAVGRLDRDTTGLLLFTNAPELISRIAAPDRALPKRYVAGVEGLPAEAALARLRDGLVLEDGPTRPALARLRDDGRVELTLTEGRHHQVKRMLAAVGHPVRTLHREAVGEVALDVPEGGWRLLTEAEREQGLRLVEPGGA
ncbi:rRNA pseudouridine synthase [Aggregicoccus sp. 17bor-14]|uniref:pseudouridine synthase n=1 Tax=Myxococcaceae TaxID=31 RepID=UPI00129C3038|nr:MULTISPECIES: pseudouridine synthase [Myxococcaceae]MBF5043895.1 rRNA pseudouridine synthase [Simulacricoccus sp. 17bor-14]MRI89646.1 rRNA pseudouridine synthase [Aggregicoccus sp. 17bor-14]